MKDIGTGVSIMGAGQMRVLEILGNAIVGGMESSVLNLIRALPQEQFEVLCICPYESAVTDKLRALGSKVYIAAIRDDPPWSAIEMAATVIRQQRIDLVHAHLLNAYALAALAGSLTGVPVVTTIHSMALMPQEISVARISDSHVITVCQQAFANALSAGVVAGNLSLIPNGIDLDRFRPSAERAFLRSRVGVPSDAVLIGFVGRLSPEKGPDKFLLAAQSILRERPDVHCVLMGEGPEEPRLRAMVHRHGLSANVHFAGGVEKVELAYPALDILLQTSRSEAMPLAVIEAMACGVPVVGLSVGGVAEIIKAGVTGIPISPVEWPGVLSPYPGDWPGIAQAALELIDDPERRRSMGRAARDRAVELFDLARQAAQTASLFHRLINDRRALTLHGGTAARPRKRSRLGSIE